ncbi:MAG: hypothetical protein AUJ98_00805 [Bacteroidetes bacterium CG2_30_33_31]|nr:MAG: hypothetical protein AUJ98_00805 [Bacteroidetes bacterium CG2_30_33_31]
MIANSKKYWLTLAIIITCFLQGFSQDGKTLNVNAYGINMNFAIDRSKIKSNELATNVLRIINNTNKDMELMLQITPPAAWKIFGEEGQKITIKAKDSAFYPVRVRPYSDVKGNTNYVVNAFLSSESFTITNAIWYIEVNKLSQWNVYTPENKIYFSRNNDTAYFEIRLSNNGNSDEALQVSLFPEKEIELVNLQTQSSNLNEFSVFLKVGKDTTIRLALRNKTEEFLPESNANISNENENSKVYRLKIKVTNERVADRGTTKLWTGNIDFLKLPNSTKIMDASVESVPMTVELNTYDMLSQTTYSSLNIFGSKTFTNNSILTYYYQADFVKNEIDLKSYLGNYVFLNYTHKRFAFELGDIGSNRPGSTLNGKGIKASVNVGSNIIGGLFIRKPKLFDNYYAEGFGGYHTFKGKKLYIDNYYQHINNDWNKVVGDFGTSDWNYQVARNQMIRFGGGYSLENLNWVTGAEKKLTGYGWKIGYSGNFKKLSFTANSYYGSKDYSPLRGTFSISSSARYRINQQYTLSASGYRFNFNPNIYTFGRLTNDSLYNIQDNYSLKLSYQKEQNVFIFQPTYYTVNSNPIESSTAGMAFEYRRLSKTSFKFYTTAFAGYTKFQRVAGSKDIFVTYVQSSLRYKRFQFNTRYYYGPYYTIEQVDYIRTKINPQKIYTTLFYDYWFLDNKMKINFNINHFYTTIHDRNQFITRPELFYYAPNGFRFSLYARYMFYGEGAYTRNQYHAESNTYTEEIVPESTSNRFEFGAGIKFNVNMPTGLKRFYKVNVIAFRDLNGNGVQDPNEKGITEMLIMLCKNDTITNTPESSEDFNAPVKVYELVTNSKGMVEYDNLPMGDYVITAKPLTTMGGWFDGKTFYRTIDKNKTIYIPLSKGARISGGILMERAKYTDNKSVFLGNIRVTAMNVDNGKTFSTLTDKDGLFVLFAPNGNYQIIINDAAIGSRFEFLQNNIPLNVTKDFENYNVSFYLVEKERTMRISNTNKPVMPIQRSTQNKQITTEDTSANIADREIIDTAYIPISNIKNDSSKWVVKIFEGEGSRETAATFKAINDIATINCVIGVQGGYIYFTETLDKKSTANKLMKRIIKSGFKDAKVVPLDFINQ